MISYFIDNVAKISKFTTNNDLNIFNILYKKQNIKETKIKINLADRYK
jgi:hypothetical protein